MDGCTKGPQLEEDENLNTEAPRTGRTPPGVTSAPAGQAQEGPFRIVALSKEGMQRKPRGTSWEICTLKYFNTARRKEEKRILTPDESKILEYMPMAVSPARRFIILKLGSGRRGLKPKGIS
nr:hypothetical protein [Tanacetum cinerariifolium]